MIMLSFYIEWEWSKKCAPVQLDTLSCVAYHGILFFYHFCRSSCPKCPFTLLQTHNCGKSSGQWGLPCWMTMMITTMNSYTHVLSRWWFSLFLYLVLALERFTEQFSEQFQNPVRRVFHPKSWEWLPMNWLLFHIDYVVFSSNLIPFQPVGNTPWFSHKFGDLTEPNNYKPISLNCYFESIWNSYLRSTAFGSKAWRTTERPPFNRWSTGPRFTPDRLHSTTTEKQT